MAKALQTGAEFHKFENEPIFIGRFENEQIRENDGPADKDGVIRQKAGDVLGYNFVDQDGAFTIIGNSHAIEKSIKEIKKGDILGIKFLGKTQNSKNQPVNRFEVYQFDSFEEANDHYYPKEKNDDEPEGQN